ncbi:hypothetical protein N825_03800 [Skermanella stibiiresistens SB22]|uniref:G domain-containing protein n=1 Tax=Skermanella stibiiresistens SB22 TaxID=1385369 RepID=W9H5W2_9PROT|nr:GTPase [Skermanella stibiiresistens]EWY40102.1 hypothetical protein N825_03800 [Skermanella stibiiresistens SB22]
MLNLIGRAGGQISTWWRDVYDTVLNPKPDAKADTRIAEEARARAPVIWLLGMVGSGKSSIIRTLTGSGDAEVGTGYRPCTATARIYEFPAEAPVVRFLDTRGLGEVAYDPAEDLALCEERAHLVLAVVRASGPVPAPILEALTQVRRRHPDWPVVVAQTTLHDAYPGPGMPVHPLPYPFGDGTAASGVAALDRSLAAQRASFAKLPGTGAVRFAPIDFTPDEDGLAPADYGIEALWAALEAGSADGVVSMMRHSLRESEKPGAGRAASHVWGYAAAAGAIDTLPVAGVIGVPVVQGKMLHSLAGMLGVSWTRATLVEFSGCLGAGALLRFGAQFGVRQLVKLVPGYGTVIGGAAAGAASFATTYGLGHAAILYLTARRSGSRFDAEAVAEEFRRAMAEATGVAKASRMFSPSKDGASRDEKDKP